MSSDDRERSLAEQAASWVPPWERAMPIEVAEPGEPGRDGLVPDEPGRDGLVPDEPGRDGLVPDEPGPDEAGPDVIGEPDAIGEPDDPGEPGAQPAAGPVEAGAAAEPPAGEAEVHPQRFDPALADAVLPLPAPPQHEEVQAPPAAYTLIGDSELRGALEAILLVLEEPASEVALAQALEQPAERITELLAGLADEYESTGRGFELRRAAGGWRLYTRPQYAQYVERFVLDGQQLRLTQAALETLAVIAYKQPVTRSRISAIRGVNCDGVIRTLVSRGLVEECGAEPDSGAFLYRTTTMFLEKLGLNSVEELPPLAPFLPDDVDEIADAPH